MAKSPEILPLGEKQAALDHPPFRSRRYRQGPDITVEELTDRDLGYASEIEVVHPDELEEPDTASETSDTQDQDQDSDDKRDSDAVIVSRLRRLHCQDGSLGLGWGRQQDQHHQQKDSSSSAGLKRTHSESIGTDTEAESLEALDDQDHKSNTRRLRRRVRGPNDSSSFIFEDLHAAPLSDIGEHTGGSDNEAISDPVQGLAQSSSLPYWVLEDPMDIDSSSQSPATPAG